MFTQFFCEVNGSHERSERDRAPSWVVEEKDAFIGAGGVLELNGELVPVARGFDGDGFADRYLHVGVLVGS